MKTRTLMILGLLVVSGLVPGASAASALSATNVEPSSLLTGANGTVTTTFTILSSINITPEANILVTFPGGFVVSGASGGSCSTNMTGTFATSISGQTVNITRQNDGTNATGAQTCTFTGIKNKLTEGSTGTYSISITNATGAPIVGSTTVTADTITPSPLAATNVQPASLAVGANGTATVSFTTTNPLANGQDVAVTFPAGFDLANVTATDGACTGMDGTFSTFRSGQFVRISRTGGGSVAAAGAYTCTIANVVNPLTAGTTGTYTIQTEDTSEIIDRDATVPGDVIGTTTTSSPNSGSGSPKPGSHGTYTGAEGQVSKSDSKNHELTYSGTRGVQTITVTLANAGPVGFQTTTKDESPSGLPGGYTGTTFLVDIKQTSGGNIDTAQVTLGPFQKGQFADDPSQLVVLHGVGATWIPLDTVISTNPDGTFSVAFTTTSFSPFALAVAPSSPGGTTPTEPEQEEESPVEEMPAPALGSALLVALLGASALVSRRKQ